MSVQNIYFPCSRLNRDVLLFRTQEPKASVTYCDHASSIRPSVRLFTFSTSFPELLGRFWWNLVGMKYSWSLASVVVFSARSAQGRGQNRSWGSSSSNNFFFRPEGFSNKPNAYDLAAWGEVFLLLLVPFKIQIDAFWRLFELSHFGVF